MFENIFYLLFLFAAVQSLTISEIEVESSIASMEERETENGTEHHHEHEYEHELQRMEDLCKKYGSKHTMCLPTVGSACGEGSVSYNLISLNNFLLYKNLT